MMPPRPLDGVDPHRDGDYAPPTPPPPPATPPPASSSDHSRGASPLSLDVSSRSVRSDGLPSTDPSEPFTWRVLVRECLWPGAGLFGESYLLFSVGVLRPAWRMLFPEDDAGDALAEDLALSSVAGVVVGMVALGAVAGRVGRRRGSVATAAVMSAAATAATAAVDGGDAATAASRLRACLFAFGVGVGGEYPLSASSASERAAHEARRRGALEHVCPSESEDTPTRHNGSRPRTAATALRRQRRGRRVLSVFAMQGAGVLANCATVTLFARRATDDENGDADGAYGNVAGRYDGATLLTMWRTVYAVSAVLLTAVLISRVRYLEESAVWEEDQRSKTLLSATKRTKSVDAEAGEQTASPSTPPKTALHQTVSSLSETDFHYNPLHYAPSSSPEEDLASSPLALLFRNYGPRLFGTSAAWLLWDVAFYGNRLFQSEFLLALAGRDGSVDLTRLFLAATLNAAVALAGQIVAALTVDRIGRFRLQTSGLLATSVSCVACGLTRGRGAPTTWSTGIYLCGSFFGQWGPNATTFLIPAEVFPTEMRTFCHGVSAACGKLGALLAGVVFARADDAQIFMVSGYATLAACVVTYVAVPETTRLDLFELDKRWRMIVDGRKAEYRGPATDPEFCSLYERQRMGMVF